MAWKSLNRQGLKVEKLKVYVWGGIKVTKITKEKNWFNLKE